MARAGGVSAAGAAAARGAESSSTRRATLRPISTAKLVPRSHGYTWLIEAKYNPGSGVRSAGMLRE